MPRSLRIFITFDIKPTEPHTGYGYIKPGEKPEGGTELRSSRKNLIMRLQGVMWRKATTVGCSFSTAHSSLRRERMLKFTMPLRLRA